MEPLHDGGSLAGKDSRLASSTTSGGRGLRERIDEIAAVHDDDSRTAAALAPMGEVLQRVLQLDQAELSDFSRLLTGHWQNLAYGHRLPPESLKRGLCEGWRRLFGRRAAA